MDGVLRDYRLVLGGGAVFLLGLLGVTVGGDRAAPFALMAVLSALLVLAAAGAVLDVVVRSVR